VSFLKRFYFLPSLWVSLIDVVFFLRFLLRLFSFHPSEMTRNILFFLPRALTMFMFIEANSKAVAFKKVSFLFYCKSSSTWMKEEINSVVAVKTSNINIISSISECFFCENLISLKLLRCFYISAYILTLPWLLGELWRILSRK
jgi:hypothetical protein